MSNLSKYNCIFLFHGLCILIVYPIFVIGCDLISSTNPLIASSDIIALALLVISVICLIIYIAERLKLFQASLFGELLATGNALYFFLIIIIKNLSLNDLAAGFIAAAVVEFISAGILYFRAKHE